MNTYNKLPDDQLAALLRLGDQQAFTEVYDRFHDFLYVFSYRLTGGDTAESEDIVQEVFINLWNHHQQLKDSDTLFPYLKASVRNGFLMQERRRTTHSRFQEELKRSLSQGVDSTDDYVYEKELVSRLEELAAGLPGKMGKVFWMTHFENHSPEEIGLALNISQKTVRNLLTMAVSNIRLRMGLAIAISMLLS